MGGSGDLVKTTGTGSITLVLRNRHAEHRGTNGFGIGTYALLQVAGTGTLTDNATFTILGRSNFTQEILKPGDAIDADAGIGNVPAGEILLEVLTRKITWLGNINGNWDTATANWNGDATLFTDFSNVTFDDTATGTTNLTVVPALVQPNVISFNNSAKDYTIGGNPINVLAGNGIIKSQAGAVTLNNSVTTPTTSITAGTVSIGSTGSYTSTTSATVRGGVLNVDGTFTTPVLVVTTGGVLNVAPNFGAGSLGSTTGLSVDGASSASFKNASQTLASLSGAGAVNLTGTALTLNGGTYSGTLSGSGGSSLVVAGPVTLADSKNDYGNTTVSGTGILTAASSGGSATGSGMVDVKPGGILTGGGIVSGRVLVENNGSLQGTGTFGGSASLAAGVDLFGFLSPAGPANIGSITLGAVTLENGSQLNFDVGSTGDSGTVTGPASFVGTEILNLDALAGLAVGDHSLLTLAGGFSGTPNFTVNHSGAVELERLQLQRPHGGQRAHVDRGLQPNHLDRFIEQSLELQ